MCHLNLCMKLRLGTMTPVPRWQTPEGLGFPYKGLATGRYPSS